MENEILSYNSIVIKLSFNYTKICISLFLKSIDNQINVSWVYNAMSLHQCIMIGLLKLTELQDARSYVDVVQTNIILDQTALD